MQPKLGEHKDYLEAVANWPLQPHPEAFGLHENADITCAQNEVKDLFDTVLSLQPRVSTGGGKSREDVIDEAAENLLTRMPAEWLMLDVCKWYPIMYDESQNTVLQQECMRYNKLLNQMNSTLKDVRKALKGLVVMSTELDALSTSLYNNQVPLMWESKAYPSLKPLVLWQEDLLRRCKFIDDWYVHVCMYVCMNLCIRACVGNVHTYSLSLFTQGSKRAASYLLGQRLLFPAGVFDR